jgi:hypothetical protein
MNRGPKPGSKAAIEAAIASSRPLGPGDREPEQLALGDELAPVPARSPGRPAGSRNRATQDFAAYLDSMGASPGVALAKIVRDGPVQLAQDLGITREAAFGRWLSVVETLMPYAHPKLAQIQLDANVSDAGAMHLLAVAQVSEALASGQTLELEPDRDDLDGGGHDGAE